MSESEEKGRSIHKVGAYRVLSADSMEHLVEYTKFLIHLGWVEYGGVIVMLNPADLQERKYMQQMVIYDERRLE
jgi:hypothetical protein